MVALPTQQSYPMVNLNITPDGLIISIVLGPGISINHIIASDMMAQVVEKWLETHEPLMNEIIKNQLAAKKAQLAIVQHVGRTRND